MVGGPSVGRSSALGCDLTKASLSLEVLSMNDPPTGVSSCRADSLLCPNQKCCNNTWSGINRFGPVRVKHKNLAHDAPIDS